MSVFSIFVNAMFNSKSENDINPSKKYKLWKRDSAVPVSVLILILIKLLSQIPRKTLHRWAKNNIDFRTNDNGFEHIQDDNYDNELITWFKEVEKDLEELKITKTMLLDGR